MIGIRFLVSGIISRGGLVGSESVGQITCSLGSNANLNVKRFRVEFWRGLLI